MSADEPRRSVRATKGQHTKSLDILDQPAEPPKKSTKKGTAAKKAQSQEVTSPAGDSSNDVIRCVCGATEQDDESTEMWICCETCEAWQHNVCVGMPDEVAEDVKYWCEKCRPENHKPLLENPDLWKQRQHEREVRDAVARKSKKAGKKGKAKRVSDAKSVTSQATNGKAASPAISEAGSTKKDKKETASRATSMKRKARDSSQDKEANKAPQSKMRKVIAPAPTPEKKQLAPTPADHSASFEDLDTRRQGAVKGIKSSLEIALNKAVKNGFELPAGKTVGQMALQLSLEIEGEAHGVHTKEDYTGQCRALLFNLKNNQKLCDRLLAGELRPSDLATMKHDDMATEELLRSNAEMMAKSDRQAVLLDDDGPRIRRNHKGEELVEQETFNLPSEETFVRRRSMLDPNGQMGERSRENSLGEGQVPESLEEHHIQENMRGAAALNQRPAKLDTAPARKASAQSDFEFQKILNVIPSPATHQRQPSIPGPTTQVAVDDPEIDRMLEDGDESDEYEPAEHVEDHDIVWRGTFDMPHNYSDSMHVYARHIGGADLSVLPEPHYMAWTDVIPETLTAEGKVGNKDANEYLCGLRYHAATDVVVAGIYPQRESDFSKYREVCDYFLKRKCFGVLHNPRDGKVKDTYVTVAPEGNEVPEILMALAESKLPSVRENPCLLVICVLHNRPITLDTTDSPGCPAGQPQSQVSPAGPPGPQESPITPAGNSAFQAPSQPPSGTQKAPLQPSPHQFSLPEYVGAYGQRKSSIPPTPQFPGYRGYPATGTNATGQPEHPVIATPEFATLKAAAEEMERVRAHHAGEAMARKVLGDDLMMAPVMQFILPQAPQMREVEFEVIREIFLESKRAQDDLQYLTDMIKDHHQKHAARNAQEPGNGPKKGEGL